ncbi:hypothetical protein, partial, partial [Parasitella parasitica]
STAQARIVGFKWTTDKQETVDEREEETEVEEEKIPSDLTVDHHPYRIYNANSRWVINNFCISDSCYNLKDTTLQVVKHINPAQISDIRILVLNDIYVFDKNPAFSVSKYLPDNDHNAIKPTLFFGTYTSTKDLECYDWCLQTEACPPVDWPSSLSLCAELLTKACKSGNILDMHTALVLTQILPVLNNGPPDDTVEDSYAHYYLSALSCSVFSFDSRLKLKWANGQLKSDTANTFKPDFTVCNLSGSAKCVVLIAEFKQKEQNSYIESDLVKLAKMKSTLNLLLLVSSALSKPICESINRDWQYRHAVSQLLQELS